MSGRPAVRALVALATALGVWVACSGGLNVDEGNAFPCDFRQAEETRDKQCPPRWACGIDGRCHDAEAELEPLVNQPTFDGGRLFPKVLTGDTRLVVGEPRERALLTTYEDGRAYLVQGPNVRPFSGLSNVRLVAVAGRYLLVQGERAQLPVRVRLYELLPSGTLSPERFVQDAAGRFVADVELIRALSVAPSTTGAAEVFAVLLADGQAGEVDPVSARYTPFPANFSVLPDGSVVTCSASAADCPRGGTVVAGRYSEVRHVPYSHLATQRQQQDNPTLQSTLVPVVATSTHLLWRELPPSTTLPDGRWQVLYTSQLASVPAPAPPDGGPPDGGPPPPPPPPPPSGPALTGVVLRHSERANLWAMKRTMQGPGGGANRDVLSTFEVSRAPALPGPAMSLAWDDCAPCGDGRVLAFTPVTDGALGVEVLCESGRGSRGLFRVVGSSVVSPRDACLVQPLQAPFELKELASRLNGGFPRAKVQALDDSRGTVMVMGGAHGQLWVGAPLSQMRPAFLDRTPMAAESFPLGLAALTPNFIALGPPDNGVGPTEMNVLMAGPPDAGGTSSLGLGSVVQGAPGWLLGMQGQLVQVEPRGMELAEIRGYGPRLVGPSGQLTTGPFQGQGVPFDGGVSLVLSANDQLYYVDLPKVDLKQEVEEVGTLMPRLTPDPNFPVRSLARDQTVSLTETAKARVRGWASTDRSVFQFEQSGATGGWTMQALPIGDGEPVEVWSREAGTLSYGRLGLRDGLVLRLPEGLPLTQRLPGDERVVDYASLAGWPVALGEQGIYRTAPTKLASGEEGLLKWERLPLPEGMTEGELEGARITVVTERTGRERGRLTLYLFTRTGFVYRLGEGAR